MLHNKNVWILMTGEFIANLGLWLGTIGNLEFLQNLVPSDLLKSLILLVGLFAGVLFGPLAGKLIDQHSKKRIMIYSGLLRIVSVGFMFIAISQESILWMSVYMVFIGVANAFYLPALQASIPLIAKDHQLLTINGLHMNVGTIARIMGTALAGVALLYLSLTEMYFLSMLTYIFIFCTTFFLQIEEERVSIPKGKQSAGFKEVWPMLKTSPVVLMGLLLLIVPTLFLGSFNLMVLKIGEIQGDPTTKSWLYTAEGIGFLIGAALARRISEGNHAVHIMLFCSLFMAVSHLSLFFADMKIPSILSFAIFGTAAGIFFPTAATMFQTMVQRDMHGRFFSFKGMADRIGFQIVLVTAGLFLDTIGFKYMVLTFGGISLIMVILFMMNMKKMSVEQKYTNMKKERYQ